MQLTGGQYKGTKLLSPIGARSTLSIVRESVFNILGSHFGDFCGLKFLDGFSGSAIMALEAYSRGFEFLAVEKDFKIAQIARSNFEKLKIKPSIIVCDFMKLKGDNFDVIYLDPPWDLDYKPIIEQALKFSPKIIICEHQKTTAIEVPYGFKLKQKKYGRAILSILHTL